MRRNLMVLTVSPIVLFLAMVQAGRAMAVDKADQIAETTKPAASFPASRVDERTAPPFLLPALQITTTAPAPALVPPALGPSSTTTTTTVTPDIESTDTVTESTTPALVPTEEATITPTLTTVQVLTDTQESSVDSTDTTAAQAELDAAYALPIEGTIIANRTEANVRFFVEGATYELDPLRSIGLDLPRVTAVLNLYNCDAATPETTEGCFWDPYLLDRDGFYEVVPGADVASASNLTLQPAGSPPVNQIWLQNRSGKRETIFYEGEEIELPPAAVHEFSSAADVPAIIYLRSCLVLSDRTVCEWVPADAEPGFYYALEETTIAGSLPNSEIVALELRPILSKDGDPVELPAQVNCQLQVPTLNVRSGPGLEYQIIAKIRGTEQEPGRVTAVGRDSLGDWLAVDARIAPGGWIVASSSFIQCNGDINSLPIAEITDGRLAPTPEPVVTAPDVNTAPAEEGAAEAPAEEATPEPEAAAPLTLAEGQALLIVNNGFDQEVRFTLDQRFRIEQGVSEYDLKPGESISLLVYPGQVAFSVSSPWRGLSGNSEFFIDNKESRTLWLVFVPDPDGSGRWILQY
ncbi:MAG TPA: hypothetical protein P5121_00590 [Caldilineaceae bacterium]|nr:hypothetical protein [Caldilineaceae bacterium]